MYLLVAVLVSFTAVVVGDVPSTTDISAVVNACNQFSFDLNEQIKKPGTNTFFSSYSICTAMAMVLAGAAGNTATQLRNTFHYDANQNIHSVYRILIENLKNLENQGFILRTANRLYGAHNFAINPIYQKFLEIYYKAAWEQTDFTSGRAENTINLWVSQQTQQKIKDLFLPDSLAIDTKVVLANAIYFKGLWLTKFNKALTRKGIFKVSKRTNQQVDMMNIEANFPYKEDEDLKAQVLHLPYAGGRLFMLVVLPYEDFGLDAVLKKLNAKKLKSLLNIPSKKIHVKFPKFTAKTEYELVKPLKKLNSTDVFSNSANFSRISRDKLKVTHVKHKAFVQVDEEGTKAAAATTVAFGFYGVILRVVQQFHVDHPFYFAIVDKKTGLILFSGQMLKLN